MSERLIARIVIGLSLALVLAEAVLIGFYGIRMELVMLPLVVFLASLGVVFGVTALDGSRPDIESVSMRRARAKKDELVRKRLDGYEVDEEFLPGGGHKKKGRRSPAPAAPEAPVGTVSPAAVPHREEEPFAGLDPVLLELAEEFGGPGEMVRKIEAMDAISYKRLQYALDLQDVDRDELLRPVREAIARAVSGPSGLRRSLDEDGMNRYIEQTLSGRRSKDDGYSLDLDPQSLGQGYHSPSGEFSHDPRSVIDRFKQALKKE